MATKAQKEFWRKYVADSDVASWVPHVPSPYTCSNDLEHYMGTEAFERAQNAYFMLFPAGGDGFEGDLEYATFPTVFLDDELDTLIPLFPFINRETLKTR